MRINVDGTASRIRTTKIYCSDRIEKLPALIFRAGSFFGIYPVVVLRSQLLYRKGTSAVY